MAALSVDPPESYMETWLRARAATEGVDVESLAFAEALDAADELAAYREQVHFPQVPAGSTAEQVTYLCGNSLGLQPKSMRSAVLGDLDRWAQYGVEGHFVESGPGVPWWTIEDLGLPEAAAIVGAKEHEVAIMNSLTVNLHLLLAAFYRPTACRYKIVLEANAFPSDEYAVQSVARRAGYEDAVVRVTASTDDELAAGIRAVGDQAALILVSPLQYLSGVLYDVAGIVAAGRDVGAVVGLDLAHAVGNVELSLHDHQVDFACWCSYKYLNAGPGAIAGAFVHERHADLGPNALRGWWGNDRTTRFQMRPTFEPRPGVAGLQLSNPPTLPVVQLKEALQLTAKASMPKLRLKSKRLTALLQLLLKANLGPDFNMLTPSHPDRRGAQLSLLFTKQAGFDIDAILAALNKRAVFVDVRRPDVIRVAPAPLYNSFQDVHRFVTIIADVLHHAKPPSSSSSSSSSSSA